MGTARTLLAIDLATLTGFAWGPIDPNFAPRSAAIRFRGECDDDVWASALQWTNQTIKDLDVAVAAIEAPINAAGTGSTATMVRLLGLQTVVRTVIAMRLPAVAKIINVRTARKFFIGQGNLPGEEAKTMVRRKCLDLGWLDEESATFDKADALCVFAAAAAVIDPNYAADFTVLSMRAKRRGASKK